MVSSTIANFSDSDHYSGELLLLRKSCALIAGFGTELLLDNAELSQEAERGSPKGWNSIVEIPYRGGIYRGKCQGGLPDGKGRLTSMDGSFYEGFWKCGKRSGLGTFCYSNGDLFRGPWRDDVMHGKANGKHIVVLVQGWFYFHTGDRWFANFWRDKANGNGRLFSKDGSVFFGIFRDGWRHGQGVCIEADGSRGERRVARGGRSCCRLLGKEEKLVARLSFNIEWIFFKHGGNMVKGSSGALAEFESWKPPLAKMHGRVCLHFSLVAGPFRGPSLRGNAFENRGALFFNGGNMVSKSFIGKWEYFFRLIINRKISCVAPLLSFVSAGQLDFI
ncbi:Protein ACCUMULATION AND REPLICATION OF CHLOROPLASTS 3 [Platanthera guangdongensis]|uniref:Protein ACCUMULATION AND REPLICATION OF CHLOROPLASTS 3 n=1 Tax=Platanthera guangdongensis TaxID=2320717 RepID=A0ABR2MA31_9ASPA